VATKENGGGVADPGGLRWSWHESGLCGGPTSPRSAGCKPLSAKAAYAVWVAQACGIAEDLGTKGKGGVLKSQQSRAAFLSAEGHRIRLVYTPKHTSWLNQVEMGFSILVRKLLRRSSFTSVEDLKARILAFIDYFNRTMAKPIRWLYSAKPKPANGTGRSHPPMTDFQVGDRVRVRDLPSVTSYAGRTGEITWVLHTSDDLVYLYYVRLDRDSPNVFAASQATFRPDELEPETEPVR